MKRLLRNTLSTISYRVIRLMNGAPVGLRILMYHRVTDVHPTDRLCVPVARFAEQMRYLCEAGYHTWTMVQAVQWIQGAGDKRQETSKVLNSEFGIRSGPEREDFAFPRPAPINDRRGGRIPHSELSSGEAKKMVVITFDDGFEDNFLFAYPILQQYGFTGCFFVPSAFIERGQGAANPSDRPMTWAQLRELLQAGYEIGAHSITHRKLTLVADEDMHREVRESKATLERALERPVRWFCYPAGDYNDAVKRAVIASGYEGACTVESGANLTGADPFALTRTEISAVDSLWDFQKKLAGAYDWMHTLIQRAQGYSGRQYRQPTNAITT